MSNTVVQCLSKWRATLIQKSTKQTSTSRPQLEESRKIVWVRHEVDSAMVIELIDMVMPPMSPSILLSVAMCGMSVVICNQDTPITYWSIRLVILSQNDRELEDLP